MKAISLRKFGDRAGGAVHGLGSESISGFATDSRDVKPGDLFLCIRGENVDGHEFAVGAWRSCAAAALAERPVDCPHILVPNLVEALARYGRSVREEFKGPVVGVTGSAGKTTTKEFLAAALTPAGPVLKSEGNRNTEYTSPLVWAELEADTGSVVVEMAMRGFGQIEHLASIARPTAGVITNIGYAHMEMVGSRAGVARAKGELIRALPANGLAVLPLEAVREFGAELGVGPEGSGFGVRGFGLRVVAEGSGFGVLGSGGRVITFGFEPEADCRITSYAVESWTSARVEGVCCGQAWQAQVPAAGRHIALDAAAALATAFGLRVSLRKAARALSAVKLPPMRMEIRDVGGATVLLDTYNASPPSMIGAMETLAEAPVNGRRVAVLGEMRELGPYSEAGHRAVGEALRRLNLDEAILVGDSMRFALEAADGACVRAGSREDARALLGMLRPGDAALIKGSRALELEKLLEMA